LNWNTDLNCPFHGAGGWILHWRLQHRDITDGSTSQWRKFQCHIHYKVVWKNGVCSTWSFGQRICHQNNI